MSSIVITVKSARADLTRFLRPSDERKAGLQSLAALFEGCMGGTESASVDVQSSASDPVAASVTATLATVAADDSITIGGVTLTAKAAPAGEAQWSQAGTDTADAAALAACINAHSTLSKVVAATSAAAVVTITCLVKGVVGNFITCSEAGITITLSATALSGGTGGATTAAKTYSAGL